MVDSSGLGADVAAGITIPAHDITSEPSMCNSTANGVPVFAAITNSNTVRIVEADHCDFQSPADAFCGLCSAPNPDHTTESIQAAIRGLSTGALLWRAGVDPRVSRVMDIKTPGSGEVDKNRWANLPLLTAHDQIKFVLCDRKDYDWARMKLDEHELSKTCDVLFSPVFGSLSYRDLADWILADRLPVRMQLQLHKHIWGDVPGH